MVSEFFTVLTNSEAANKLKLLSKDSGKLIFFSGNEKELLTSTILSVSESDGDGTVVHLAKAFVGQEVKSSDQEELFSFKIGGILYFGKSIINKVEEGSFYLNIVGSVYRLERREGDRLLTYPHLDVYLVLPFANALAEKNDNVIFLNKSDRQAQLKLNDKTVLLLKMVDEKNWKKFSIYRAMDISIDGASILVSPVDTAHFEIGKLIENGFLLIGEEKYTISNITVLGCADYINRSNKSDIQSKVNLAINKFDAKATRYIEQRIGKAWDRVEICNRFYDFMKVIDNND